MVDLAYAESHYETLNWIGSDDIISWPGGGRGRHLISFPVS